MNLLHHPFLPVVCSDGSRACIEVSEIGETFTGQVPARFDFPSALLNAAAMEMCIAIFQTLLPPATESDWRAGSGANRPSPLTIKQRLQQHAHLFDLYGANPLLQNVGCGQANKNLGQIFLDDMYFDGALEPGVAALALFLLQGHAPSGGPGYFTGICGGGPFRTIALSDDASIYDSVWLNVLTESDFIDLGQAKSSPLSQVPWVALQRHHGKLPMQNASAVHLYWGTPWKALFGTLSQGRCSITGATGSVVRNIALSSGWLDYERGAWKHPLTPHSLNPKGEANSILATKFQGTDFGWGDRVGYVRTSNFVEPAAVIRLASDRMRRMRKNVRVLAFGCPFDKRKVLGTVVREQSFRLPPSEVEQQVESLFAGLIERTRASVFLLKKAVAASRARNPDAADEIWNGSSAPALGVDDEFRINCLWNRTEHWADGAYESIENGFLQGDAGATDDAFKTYGKRLWHERLDLFDEIASVNESGVMFGRARRRLLKY